MKNKKLVVSLSIVPLSLVAILGIILGLGSILRYSSDTNSIIDDLEFVEVASEEILSSSPEPYLHNTSSPNDYDVIIVGAGTSGVSAALQATESNYKVLLVEETNWLGGQMTASGVSSMDEPWADVTNPSGNKLDRSSGYYSIFTKKVLEYYNLLGGYNSQVNQALWNLRTEPLVAHGILRQFITTRNQTPNKGRITVLYSAKVTDVLRTGDRISGIKVTQKNQAGLKTFSSKILIDASETGYIIPKTGLNYRIGNETKLTYTGNSCIQDITYVAPIKRYPNGVPSNLRITTEPVMYSEYKTFFSQLVGSDSIDTNLDFPWTLTEHNRYRAMPDSSTNLPSIGDLGNMFNQYINHSMVNFANDYPAKLPYLKDQTSDNYLYLRNTLSNKYLIDESYKQKIDCEAKLKTINFIYYIQKELNGNWSVSNTAGYYEKNSNTQLCSQLPEFSEKFAGLSEIEKYLPPIPYIRESIRIIGKETLTAKDVKEGKRYSNSIAFSGYPIDLHNCKVQVNTSEGFYNNYEDFESPNDIPTFVPRLFEIPLGTLLPSDLKGFIVAEKNISQSRFANGGTRLQPSTFSIGQAAGALAVELIKANYDYSKVNPINVQLRLTKTNAVISSNILKDITLINNNNSIRSITTEDFAAIQFVEKAGIMSAGGFGGDFRSLNTVKRADASVVLARVTPFEQVNYPQSNNTPRTFVDVPPYLSDN